MNTPTGSFERLTAMITPRSIAILGASAKKRASGNEAIANLRAHAYPESQIFLVHPVAEEIDGLPTVSSASELPVAPDVALISLPAAAVVAALEELEARGCRSAIVPTAGFTPEQLTEFRGYLARTSMVVHGHNCMGIINVADGIPLWFYEDLLMNVPKGRIALVSQSGSATFLAHAVDGQGFSRIFSTGNETALTTADYIEWLAADDSTSVVGVVIESIKDIARFTECVRILRASKKPLVVLKVGRTEGGQRAAMAHTGALVSNDAAFQAFFEALDVPLVEDYDELAIALQVLATPELPRAAGTRISVITDSGGEAGLSADIADRRRIPLAEFTTQSVAALSALVPGGPILNPFDAGASPATSDDQYAEAYAVVGADKHVDSVVIVGEFHAEMSEAAIRVAFDMLGDAVHAATRAGKPVVLASSSSTSIHPLARRLFAPVPVVRGIGNALVAMTASGKNRLPVRDRGAMRPFNVALPVEFALLRQQLASTGGVVDAALSARVLDAYGIPRVESIYVEDIDSARAWADARYPLVVKVSSPDIAHRSDVGGVKLNVTTAAELEDAFTQIRADVSAAAPSARIDGFELQVQIGASHEAMIGISNDPQLGPIIVAGSGGVLVEILDDTESALAPLDPSQVETLILSTRLSKLLAGYRHLTPATPAHYFNQLLERVSWLAHDLQDVVAELDLNPVLIEYGSGRVAVVDELLVARNTYNTARILDEITA